MKNETENKRIVWVDNVKNIAFILVALGHLLQGLIKAGIMQNSAEFTFFNTFIYTFHVPLFFICSGYLYQKTTVVNDFKSYGNNVLKKAIALGIPYFVFSIISFLLKVIFSGSVNSQAGGFIETLFTDPVPPFWFLYTLFIIFLIMPTAKSIKSAAVMFGISAVFMCAVVLSIDFIPQSALYVQFVYKTALYLVWFALGILLAEVKLEKIFSPVWIISFIIAGVAVYFSINAGMQNNYLIKYAIGIPACFGVIGTVGWIFRKNVQSPLLGFLSKYSMSVFLMHTIFSAGLRAVLLKINITNTAVHIIAGIIASFVLPVIAQIIMEKIHLDFVIYPLKYIKIGKKPLKKEIK